MTPPVPAPLLTVPSDLPLLPRLVLRRLQGLPTGILHVTLPDGRDLRFGHEGPQARLLIRQPAFFRRVVLAGEIGFGESYMAGEWETDDLPTLLHILIQAAAHRPATAWAGRFAWDLLRVANRWRHFRRDNTRQNSRRNIEAHYDLSNDFYRLWLDRTLTYSSAFFEGPEQPLEAAQLAKYRRLASKLRLQPGQHVLEIGCGWGGFALYAARHHGVHVTGLTISREQFALARERVAQAGLQDRVDIRFQDYRDASGQFDAIASIEMLEAVGHRHLATFFAQCHRLLKPHGVLGLQVILSPDARYSRGRRSADWIKKHIFPGGQLPSLTAINHALIESGELTLQHFEGLGHHYARTLRLWREGFWQHIDEVRTLGFSDVFVRKWNYYLSACEAAFASRNINVAQLIYARPNQPSAGIPTVSC